MVEEQRLDEALHDVDEVVVAADVRQLVGEKGFQLAGRKTREGADGDQQDGPKPADDGRGLRER